MSSTYAGNSANNPASITIPSDGDAPIQASDVNPAFQGTLDLIRRINDVIIPGALKVQEFTSSGTFTVPDNVTNVLVIGCGGGGGGGCGSDSPGTNPDEWHAGGGGGGGALCGVIPCAVTPGAGIAVTIGAGGTGGAPLGLATVGGDTTFGSLATFKGAGYGTGCTTTKFVDSTTKILSVSGGLGTTIQTNYRNLKPADVGFSKFDSAALPAGITSLQIAPQQPGEGGQGHAGTYLAEPGATNSMGGFAGGARGVVGTSSAGFKAGGGGGGGAAGPFGAGGAGGNGGNGNNAGAGTDGANGTSAAANTGAGGGGGGGGGADSAAGNNGGSGGDGGSGRLFVIYTDGS